MKTLGDYHRTECPVRVFRARLSAYEISQLSSQFFGSNSRYVQVDESQYEPLLVKVTFYCSARSLLCAKTFLCQMYTSPDQRNGKFCRDNGLQPPITLLALDSIINALIKSHGGCMNRPFYSYDDHIELIRFKEYCRMPRGHERISFVFSSAFRDIFS